MKSIMRRSNWQGSFRRTLGIFWMEWRLLFRSALCRVAAVFCWGLAVLLVHGIMTFRAPGAVALVADPSDLCAVAVSIQILIFGPPLMAFVGASSSARERRPGIPETLFTTPPSSEEFVIGKFLAVALCVAVLLAGLLVVPWLWLQYGEHTPARFLPFYLLGMQWLMPLLFIACLGYTAGLALPGAAGGVLVFFYWIAVILANRYVSSLFMPAFGHLAAAYLSIGLGTVALAAIFYRRDRRGDHREQSWPVGLLGWGLVLGGLGWLGHLAITQHTPPFHIDQELVAEGRKKAHAGEPLPPFRLVDNHGQVYGPQSLRDRPTIFILFASMPPPVAGLPLMRALVAANAHSGVPLARLLAVFLTRDLGEAVPWGRDIDPGLHVASLYARPEDPLLGLPATLGFSFWQVASPGGVPGMMVVVDSHGRYLGARSLYEILTPPSLVASLASGDTTGLKPSQIAAEEQAAGVRFFRALWEYEQRGG